jgi:hypothetical protein
MPCTDAEADMYFSELFDVWFPQGEVPADFKREQARESFMNGGYYRHDFANTNTSLLAVNSMYFMAENKCQLSRGDRQLDWIEAQLATEGRQYILSMHVFPGLNYYKGVR